MTYLKDIYSQEYELAAARGLLSGITRLAIYGKNSDIDTGTTPETLWNGGGLYSGFSAAAQRVRIAAGGLATDSVAGTGAQKVTIYGLDGAGLEISEEVDTAGIAASVYTTLTFKRAWKARVTQVGSGAENAGQITIEQEISGDIMAVMPIGTNRTHICVYTVPAGKTLYIHSFSITTTAATTTNTQFDIFVDAGGQGIFESRQPVSVVEGGGLYDRALDRLKVTENSDIDLRCTATTSNNIISAGGFHGVLIDN